MKLTEKHLKLYKQIISDGINDCCSDTEREYYKDWTSEEIYELNYRAAELNGDLEERLEDGGIGNKYLDDYDVRFVIQKELIDWYIISKGL